MRCETCAHFQLHSYPIEVWDEKTDDMVPIPNGPWGFCQRTVMENGEPGDPDTLAWAMDGSSYFGQLNVSVNFACIQYEEKQ